MSDLILENTQLKERCAQLEEALQAKIEDYDRLWNTWQNTINHTPALTPMLSAAASMDHWEVCSTCNIGSVPGYVCPKPECPSRVK